MESADRQRLARLWFAAAMVTLLAGAVPTGPVAAFDRTQAAACVNGWTSDGRPVAASGATAVDVAAVAGRRWVAGSKNLLGGQTTSFVAVRTGMGWQTSPLASTSGQSLLMAIATDGAGGLWVAGQSTTNQPQPFIEHWNGDAWKQMSVPALGDGGGLTDVTQLSPGRALAVGYAATPEHERAIAYRWINGSWERLPEPTSSPAAFTAVSAAADGTTWAVGWIRKRSAYRPLLEAWDGTSWRGGTLRGSGSMVLTGVTVRSRTDAWAVGYREQSGTTRSIVAHWDGAAWQLDPGFPGSAGASSILRDVTTANGTVTAVGAAWTRSALSATPLVAQRKGGVWTVDRPMKGVAGELLGVVGGAASMAVGHTTGYSLAIVPCGATRARAAGSPAAGSPVARNPTRSGQEAQGSAIVHAADPAGSADETPPAAQPVSGLVVRDVTTASGLAATTLTYTAESADINRDGWPDLVIGRHSSPQWVMLNRGDGAFVNPGQLFRPSDRHGCAVGNLDADPAPEIVCAVGADHGERLKDNELWLSPLDPATRNAADNLGLADPLGRGRLTILLDYNRDGRQDVYFANDPNRPDGLPSTNRLFENTGGRFRSAPEAGLDLPIGARCLVAADLDRDGWPDLIDCEDNTTSGYRPMRIFHNDHGVFSDATERLGFGGEPFLDVAVGDLNGDGRPDLVTLTRGQMEIWLQSGGTFHVAHHVDASNLVAVTLADVNGDGAPDIYVVRGDKSGAAIQDLLLLNDSTGIHYTSVALPSTPPGPGQDAVAIDYDRNGKEDLLVLRGDNKRAGPIQLLAFGPPWPFGRP